MLSIIIPVLNESESVNRLLDHLINNLSGEIDTEILFVDGGSTDGTQEIILNFSHTFARPVRFLKPDRCFSIQIINSEKGRAKQMNIGTQNAKGEILYFLHADSFPPKNFDKYILKEIVNGNPAGCFRMKFDSDHLWLGLAGWLTQFNLKGFRGGDQSQFITKSLFDEIGGFDENYIIYEDNILIGELYKRNKFVVIPHSLCTSARRYEHHGVWNLQYHFWMIHLKNRLGADAGELYDYYSKQIGSKSSK